MWMDGFYINSFAVIQIHRISALVQIKLQEGHIELFTYSSSLMVVFLISNRDLPK